MTSLKHFIPFSKVIVTTKKTAETMFLHAKTIRYRLSKIEDYLEIDLANPTQVLNFEIGTYLLKMKKS